MFLGRDFLRFVEWFGACVNVAVGAIVLLACVGYVVEQVGLFLLAQWRRMRIRRSAR